MKRGCVAASIALTGLLLGCSSEHCSKDAGCVNEKFLVAVNSKCRFDVDGICRLSFKEAIGDFDKVYFVGIMGARLDSCKFISVSDALRKSSTPLCQYILLEKRNQQITSYLRGFCTSEVSIKGVQVGFAQENAGFLSGMDANHVVVVRKVFGDPAPGSQNYVYSIEPSRGDLVSLSSREDKCIGSAAAAN